MQVFAGARNNTQRVHEDFYLRRDKTVIDTGRDVVAAGLDKAVAAAHEQVRMRFLTGTDAGAVTAEVLAAEAGIPQQRAEEVLAGLLDTAVGACADFEHSPLSAGGRCAVSFLLCFACPNAIATTRHLPRIVYLFKALDQLRTAVSPAVWSADWAAHHARVGDLLGRHADTSRWTALLGALGARERDLIDRMLARRLDP